MHIKEIDIFGIFISPFSAYLIVASLVFFPVRMVLDRYRIETWFAHRQLVDASVFVIILCLIGLLF